MNPDDTERPRSPEPYPEEHPPSKGNDLAIAPGIAELITHPGK
jgi:hypothetical protein